MKKNKTEIIITDQIENRIYSIRGMNVMLDFHLAEMYGVETKVLNQGVKRNIERFPEDFMFRLSAEEWNRLRSQIVTSNIGRGGVRYSPYAFTEQGVAMLSGILGSKRAIAVNIQIMRVYVKFRAIASQHKDILKKLDQLERKVIGHDDDIKEIFHYMKELLEPEIKNRPQIGYVIPKSKLKK